MEAERETPLHSLILASGKGESVDGIVKRILNAMRAHLGMAVAYVSEFTQDQAVLREVVATPALQETLKVGLCSTFPDSYCYQVREGLLPELIPVPRDNQHENARQSG